MEPLKLIIVDDEVDLATLTKLRLSKEAPHFYITTLKSGRDCLTYLQDHPVQLIRAGFWGLRTLAFLGYYGQPETRAAIGYGPDARGWEALP